MIQLCILSPILSQAELFQVDKRSSYKAMSNSHNHRLRSGESKRPRPNYSEIITVESDSDTIEVCPTSQRAREPKLEQDEARNQGFDAQTIGTPETVLTSTEEKIDAPFKAPVAPMTLPCASGSSSQR